MRIVAISLEEICAEAGQAARDVLTRHGIERPSVVLHFAWRDDDGYVYAAASKVPRAHGSILRDSLKLSAEESA